MNNVTKLYSLFTKDRDQMAETVAGIKELDAQQAHWCLNIGQYSMIDRMLTTEKLVLSEKELNGLRFRLMRRNGVENPYRTILSIQESDRRVWLEKAKRHGIIMRGGIGDHIEEISRILTWQKENELEIKLIMNTTRAKQLKRIMTANSIAITNKLENNNAIPSYYLLGSLRKEQQIPISYLRCKINALSKRREGIICCWVAKGQEDLLSSWIRSVPFNLVKSLYKAILKKDGKFGGITDISEWKPWEKNQLKELGVRTVDPKLGDTMDLSNMIDDKQEVISVDTALAHLSIAKNRSTYILLPKFHDERWYKLLIEKGSYKDNCKPIHQKTYGCWKECIHILEENLTKKNY